MTEKRRPADTAIAASVAGDRLHEALLISAIAICRKRPVETVRALMNGLQLRLRRRSELALAEIVHPRNDLGSKRGRTDFRGWDACTRSPIDGIRGTGEDDGDQRCRRDQDSATKRTNFDMHKSHVSLPALAGRVCPISNGVVAQGVATPVDARAAEVVRRFEVLEQRAAAVHEVVEREHPLIG